MDSALSNTFDEKVSTISGLEHLASETVNALLDYGVVEDLIIDENGEIELPYEAQNVVIGLPYEFEFQTLNIENAATLGIKKIINTVDVKTINSREDFFIQNQDGTLRQNARSHDSINNPAKLFSSTIGFNLLNTPNVEQNITIVQKFPLPLTISAVMSTISLEGVENI